jgi:hypothetical protein
MVKIFGSVWNGPSGDFGDCAAPLKIKRGATLIMTENPPVLVGTGFTKCFPSFVAGVKGISYWMATPAWGFRKTNLEELLTLSMAVI